MGLQSRTSGRYSLERGDPPRNDIFGLLRAILALVAYAVLTGLAAEAALPF
ncbi:hypothetical protein [Desulfocurvibacter africanus]|uniref:hypothetical protein n=1 Tax=Desulfocurvibacter africanus TaxID=873 RepID=UPI000404CB6A|nr:hypothetical protein [Desulfocurvibacter africanus]